MSTQIVEEKKRKSVALAKDEIKALKAYKRTFHTSLECAEMIGLSPQVLDRVIIYGSGAPETIAKVRQAIA